MTTEEVAKAHGTAHLRCPKCDVTGSVVGNGMMFVDYQCGNCDAYLHLTDLDGWKDLLERNAVEELLKESNRALVRERNVRKG